MVDLITLSLAVQNTLREIPELVSALGGKADSIRAYIDLNPTLNSLTNTVYSMASGEILIAWQDTSITQGDTEAWEHRFAIFVKAVKTQSDLSLLTLVINGKVPGSDLAWRYCPVLDATLPPHVGQITRISNEERIDYLAIELYIKETFDA